MSFNTEVSMLCLSRKVGEQIQIGDNVTVTVIEIRGDKVRLGVEAPLETAVDRMEIRRLKCEQAEREAGNATLPD